MSGLRKWRRTFGGTNLESSNSRLRLRSMFNYRVSESYIMILTPLYHRMRSQRRASGGLRKTYSLESQIHDVEPLPLDPGPHSYRFNLRSRLHALLANPASTPYIERSKLEDSILLDKTFHLDDYSLETEATGIAWLRCWRRLETTLLTSNTLSQ